MDDLLTEGTAAPGTSGGTSASPTAPRFGKRVLPDVAAGRPDVPGVLDHVGMSDIQVVVRRRDDSGAEFRVPARADAFVDLVDPHVKGIHMSRLYLLLEQGFEAETLGPRMLERLLAESTASHAGSSGASRIAVSFEHSARRPALLSDHAGWRTYPVRIASERTGGRTRHEVTVEITYSSTCPCSAALARQLMQEAFDRRFGGRPTVPTESVRAWMGTSGAVGGLPHAQRSHGEITVVWSEEDVPADFGIDEVIGVAEEAVATAVQAVVKRADEQEFARLNAENLMFCEDAARRLRVAVERIDGVADFRIAVRHLESLHPHDAVAIVTKGVPGGLRP